jgi:hypothetical protein
MTKENDPADWDQRDVLKKKDNVTQGSRGLQIWGEQAEGVETETGDASQGTAARAGRITGAQEKAEERSGTETRDDDAGR